MRISDLSRESGVPIATIKFYLREGLVPAGRRTAPNQASYGEEHLRRLHLVRLLVEVGGLSLAGVRTVLAELDRADTSLHEVLAAAHQALRRSESATAEALGQARAETDAWLATTPWELAPDSPPREDLAAALLALRQLGWPVGPEAFERYRAAADTVAAEEIAYVGALPDRTAAVEATVVGTVIFERVLAALRRLAQEHHSKRTLSAPGPSERSSRRPGSR